MKRFVSARLSRAALVMFTTFEGKLGQISFVRVFFRPPCDFWLQLHILETFPHHRLNLNSDHVISRRLQSVGHTSYVLIVAEKKDMMPAIILNL